MLLSLLLSLLFIGSRCGSLCSLLLLQLFLGLFLLLVFQSLGLLGLGDGRHDLQPSGSGRQFLDDRGQFHQQGSLSVPRFQDGRIHPNSSGVVPEGRLVAAVALMGLLDVSDTERCQGIAQILRRGGIDGLFDANPPSLFHRFGGIEVAGVNTKKVGRIHAKAFLYRPKHLKISVWLRWRRNHVLWGSHKLLHRIATIRHLLHHVLLGLAGTLLFDTDPSSPFLPHDCTILF
mmetsp:Transcript_18630/g.38371  ORF Transcript_18630/g.38371 Transcript_18630/m.38371 type:complete len:232 (-) Transcript_18630:88-783(-)